VWIARSIVAAVLCAGPPGCSREQPEAEASAALPIEDRLARAEQMLTYGRLDPAEQLAEAITTDAADDWRGHDLLARVHLQRALDFEEAGLINRAETRMQRATNAYRAATVTAPPIAGLWRSAGDAAQMAGQIEQANTWYEHALSLQPDDVRTLLRLAQLRFAGDPAESRRLLERVVHLDPLIPESHASLALLDASEGAGEAALEKVAHAVDLDRMNPQLRIVQARVHRVLGDFASGVEILLALPPAAQSGLAATEELAACWNALGRHDREADAWAACFNAHAHRSDAWRYALNAGSAALASGNRPRAAGLFQQAEMLSAPAGEVDAARRRHQSP